MCHYYLIILSDVLERYMPKNELDQKTTPVLVSDEQIAAYQQQQKAKYAEQQAKIQQDNLARLHESFRTTCAAYYQLSDVFNRFNLQWPNKVEGFNAYENRYVGGHVIADLRAIILRLDEILQALISLIEQINIPQTEKLQQISSDIILRKQNITELNRLIENYKSAMGNNNYVERFKAYNPMAEAVQHLQYSLQF